MVLFRALALAAAAFSSAAFAAFEPLDAADLFAGGAVQFEPLDAPSATKRDLPVQGRVLPRAHQAMTRRSYNPFQVNDLATALAGLKADIGPVHAQLSAAVSVAIKTPKNSIIPIIEPKVSLCVSLVIDCGHHAKGIPHHPHPSSGPKPPGGTPGGCAGLLAEILEEIEELLKELLALGHELEGELPELLSLLNGYVAQIDSGLTDLVQTSEGIASGITSSLAKLTSDISGDLKAVQLPIISNLLGDLL